MNYRLITVIFTALAIFLTPLQASKRIKINEVPAIILKTIKKAFPGVVIEKVRVTKKKGLSVYQVDAILDADGGEFELDISIDAKGKIIKVKKDFEPDDDDDEDSDDS